jgi:DHA3 family macrolide efflux protein-like MFS transporter
MSTRGAAAELLRKLVIWGVLRVTRWPMPTRASLDMIPSAGPWTADLAGSCRSHSLASQRSITDNQAENEVWMEATNGGPKSLKTFLVIWVGQLISIIGSGLTGFGLSVWIYSQTGEATPFALNALFYNLPRILLSPLAGSIADRYNRRRIMVLTDTAAALTTLGAAALLYAGTLRVWHIYLITALSSSFSSFQDPAYGASITMLVPKKDLARAGGIQQVGGAVQSIVIPLLAATLYATIGLRGIILIDFATYFFAIGALLLVRIPQPAPTTEMAREGETRSMWRDASFGWRYLRARPGLFGLLWYYAAVNFFLNLSGVLSGPLILSFGTEVELGAVQMAGGAAMLIGGLLIGTWGGPKKRKIEGVILAIALSSLGYFLAGLRASVPYVAAGQFVILFFIPISAALSQAVWQTKVPPDIQGRVFAIRAMIAWSIIPTANLVAGPLADRICEPLMAEGGALADSWVGILIGAGTGRGIGLIFVISALFLFTLSAAVFTNPRIRNLETDIPDAIADELVTGEPVLQA